MTHSPSKNSHFLRELISRLVHDFFLLCFLIGEALKFTDRGARLSELLLGHKCTLAWSVRDREALFLESGFASLAAGDSKVGGVRLGALDVVLVMKLDGEVRAVTLGRI